MSNTWQVLAINNSRRMGLFDFFSEPEELDDVYKNALSSFFTVKNVGERQYNEGLNKLAREQSKLKETVHQDEKVILITPIFNAPHELKYYTYEGLGVITSKRVIQFKNKIERETIFDDIAKTESRIRPSGYFILHVITHTALPYKVFWEQGGSASAAFMKYYENTLMLSFPTPELHDEFVNIIKLTPMAPKTE